MSLCRTHWLGGRKYQCEDCDEITTRYNSCGDRHCPRCSGSKRADFNQKASQLLLPGVKHYQVVFTLPRALSELALANRRAMAELLNDSAWRSLSTNIRREQGYGPAGISVLHTWNQRLDAHWHVHVLVPGGGPSLDGGSWKQATPPADSPNSEGYYLVDADRLRCAYRKRAIRRLQRLRSAGQLKLGGKFAYLQSDENWEAFVRQLQSTEWVAYIQPPPSPSSKANEVVNYLTRYLTGGPISDHRITAADAREVTFLAREGQRTGGDREQVPVRLSLEEFVRRWSLHIQPEQLTKTRYLGGWSNTRRTSYMSRCLELLSTAASVTKAPESPRVDDSSPAEASPLVCSHCGSERLQPIEDRPRPSWRELFRSTSASCPTWYARLQEADDQRFWDGLMGAGFNDWYLEYAIESAKETPPPPPPRPIQLYLPGLFPSRDFALESY
jgi:hypothetical protein